MLLPPLPNFLFQRDPSCWIYDGVTVNPMMKPARRPETVLMQAIYRFHPMFAQNGGVRVWHGDADQDWGRATVEGGDVMPIGNGAVMIGMGERTAPQAVTMIARELFKAGSARLVMAVKLPQARDYMHLDTVMTMVDRDAVTVFPNVIGGARVWSIRPGDDPELPVVESFDGGVIAALKHALSWTTSASFPQAATRSSRNASSGTTATTSSVSSREWWSHTTATSTRTRASARRGSRSSRSRARSSAADGAVRTA